MREINIWGLSISCVLCGFVLINLSCCRRRVLLIGGYCMIENRLHVPKTVSLSTKTETNT